MDDLLQSQIKESCKLALPTGLTELMTDISREVLRAQPENLLQFITDYLSSLLVTRENLYIAAEVCGKVCDCSCHPELEEELRFIGLDEASAKKAADIIEEYFGQGNIKEEDLLHKLIKKTAFNKNNLPEVVTAIRNAFLRHQSNRTHADIVSPPGSDDDLTENAVKHTLALYKKTDPGYRVYSVMATKIQAAYRAYRVKRLASFEGKPIEGTKPTERSKVRFDTNADEIAVPEQDSELQPTDLTVPGPSGRFNESGMKRLSSTSLAGSFINLPEHRPYSIQDMESYEESEEEKPEKEHTNYFYTEEQAPEEEYQQDGEEVSVSDKRIPFYSYSVEELFEESESESMGDSDDNDFIDENIVKDEAKIDEEVKEIAEEIDIPSKGSDEKCTEEEP